MKIGRNSSLCGILCIAVTIGLFLTVQPFSVGATPSLRDDVVSKAIGQLGKPYESGADGPDTFDCSGLVWYCYNQCGIDLPHPRYQWVGYTLNKNQLSKADMVWLSQTSGGWHIGIYEGGDNIVNAVGDPYNIVRRSSLNSWEQSGRTVRYTSAWAIKLECADNYHTVSIGTPTGYTITVKNLGSVSDSISLWVGTVPSSWTAGLSETWPIHMDAGTSTTVTLTVTPPQFSSSADISVTGQSQGYTASGVTQSTVTTFTDASGNNNSTTWVGGFIIPIDKFGLLPPYIGLASTITVSTAATAIYIKRVKRRKEKQ